MDPRGKSLDYKTLRQVIQEAEETRRRSIELQEKLMEILRKPGTPLVREDDVIALHRGKDQKLIDVSIPRLEGKKVPELIVNRKEDELKTLFVASSSRPELQKKIKVRPKTSTAATTSKVPKKISSVRSVKEEKKKVKKISVDSSSSHFGASQLSGKKFGATKKTVKKEAINKKRKVLEVKTEETSRPNTAAIALRKSKELLDSIGRREKVPSIQPDLQAYLQNIGKLN